MVSIRFHHNNKGESHALDNYRWYYRRLAGLIMKGDDFGLIWDLILGIAGAVVGGWLFGLLGLSASGGLVGSIIVATIGAVFLIFISRLLRKA